MMAARGASVQPLGRARFNLQLGTWTGSQLVTVMPIFYHALLGDDILHLDSTVPGDIMYTENVLRFSGHKIPLHTVGATETETTSRQRCAEEGSPRHQDPSPAVGAQRAAPATDRYWTDAFWNQAISEPAPSVWLDTTILSAACKVHEPYDEHVIHLMSSQRVRIGAWRTRQTFTSTSEHVSMGKFGPVIE